MNKDAIINELKFKAIRSGGAGGQHVNKTASKVELSFDVANSNALSDIEKDRLLTSLTSKITSEGMLILQCDETRSQHKNKAIVIERLLMLLTENLKTRKVRKKTSVPKGVIEKRLKEKRVRAMRKAYRKPPDV